MTPNVHVRIKPLIIPPKREFHLFLFTTIASTPPEKMRLAKESNNFSLSVNEKKSTVENKKEIKTENNSTDS